MTPDTRGLWPPSFQDNTVGAEEKVQCTELEARIQAMKWAVGNRAAVRWEWTTQGPQIGREETQKGYLKEQLCPSVTTHIGPLALSWQASMEGLLYQKPVPLILTGNLLWQSRLIKYQVCHFPVRIKRELTLLKNFLVICDVSSETVPQEKPAHDTLQLSRRSMSSDISWGRACFQKQDGVSWHSGRNETITLHSPA